MRAAGTFGFLMASLAMATTPAPARAYLDGRAFTDDAVTGGGGGRLFTGAPGDGYDCAVCHRGGSGLTLSVDGVPADGWQPGESYDLRIAFPEGSRNVSAMIEIADEGGRAAGTLTALPEAELTELDRCRAGMGAVGPVDVADRSVARVDPCGARRGSVRWTAPSVPVRGVRLFASVVAADDSGDPSGDSAGRIVQPLRATAEPDVESGTLTPRCSAWPAARARDLPGPFGLAVLALAWLLSRRAGGYCSSSSRR